MDKRSEKKKASGNGIFTQVAVTPRLSRFSRDWLWGLLLLLAVVLAYQPVWFAGYIWDDLTIIVSNPCIVGPLGLKEIWTTNAADICPLTLTTFWMEHALWGLDPLPYHLLNVFLHGACAVVLWRVLRDLRVPGAWLGAALWALHPVQVESVAWISEMKNTESGLFFLLTILFFVKGLREREANVRSGGGWNYGLTLLFAALAMTAKTSTVILPLVLGLCAWWVEGRWHGRNLAKIAPIFLMALAAGALSIWTQKIHGTDDPRWARSGPERLVAAGDAVWFYLGKLIWPHPLVAIYPRWQVDAVSWWSYLPLLAVIIVFIILGFRRRSWSRPCLGVWAYFVAALLPELGLINNAYARYSLVADHFQYLAGMGPLALAGAGMVKIAEFALAKNPWLQSGLGAGVLLIFGMSSWQHACIYQDAETLWTDTLFWNPNCWTAHVNLGVAFFQKGQVDGAIAEDRKALEINPDDAKTHYNLGVAFFQKGRMDEAIAEYRKALEINPDDALTHNNLGRALLQKGQVDEAIVAYDRSLELNPGFSEAYCNLGVALFQKGQVDEAIVQYRKALAINPDDPVAHNNLGNALAKKGQLDEAIAEFQRALEIAPAYAKACNYLGHALWQKGQVDAAIEQYQKAVELNPNYAEARTNLGNALLQKGQVDEAITQFQEVVRLSPDDNLAQGNLTKAKALAAQRAPLK